jgi:hypothetical protein
MIGTDGKCRRRRKGPWKIFKAFDDYKTKKTGIEIW